MIYAIRWCRISSGSTSRRAVSWYHFAELYELQARGYR